MNVQTISATELNDLLNNDEDITLIDVRDEYEREICHIGGLHIPLNTLDIDKIPTDSKVVVYCKLGGRSGQAVQYLQSQGLSNIYSLEGGIFSWIEDVDPSLETY